jgi:membrane protein DedA with SNARE-associated domain
VRTTTDTVHGLIESAVNSLGDAVNPWGYVLLFLLCLLESSAFIGLFVPGETALLVGGVLSEQGKLSLVWCIVWAVLGAILGDSLGYEIGRRLGPRMRRSWLGQKVGEHRWERAHGYVRRTGGRAIFVGRFIGVLRALVPAIAGDARMPYRRFLFWNVAGAVIAVPGVIALGYAAGSSYRVVEKRIGQASYVLLGLVAVAVIARTARERRMSKAEPRD